MSGGECTDWSEGWCGAVAKNAALASMSAAAMALSRACGQTCRRVERAAIAAINATQRKAAQQARDGRHERPGSGLGNRMQRTESPAFERCSNFDKSHSRNPNQR